MKKFLISFFALFLLTTSAAMADSSDTAVKDLIPKMTASESPSGKVTSSSDTWALAQNYYAFDDINITEQNSPWISNTLPAWLGYEFASPTVVNKYTITGQIFSGDTSYDNIMRRHPKDWTFEGYNEEAKAWTILDTRSNVTSWTMGQKQEFNFSNTRAYKKYRINITSIIGPHSSIGTYWTAIGEMEMMNTNDTQEAKPVKLTATSNDQFITLNWNELSNVKNYVIKRSTNLGGPYVTISSTTTSRTYIDRDVKIGTEYFYLVTAIDSNDKSYDSNEASATVIRSNDDIRAILTIYVLGGQIKEYDLSMSEVNAFMEWYDTKDSGTGPAKYKFIKTWNMGPFKSRSEYIIFDKILSFDVDEYKL